MPISEVSNSIVAISNSTFPFRNKVLSSSLKSELTDVNHLYLDHFFFFWLISDFASFETKVLKILKS